MISPPAAPESRSFESRFRDYLAGASAAPLFFEGDALFVLSSLPAESVHCCMTSPPYFGQRVYDGGGIGMEATPERYLESLLAVFAELRRVLRPDGSFWLNLGDAYRKKRRLQIPARAALALTDRQGWILRDHVVWNKVKGGPDTARDRLRNVHEPLFHFVRKARYFFDADAVRSRARKARVEKGAVVSATGVTGVRYRRQIELSTALDGKEKRNALEALDSILVEVREGRLPDFRMILRGTQRATHSDAERVSGRARELRERGFYFLRYHPKGSRPSDVWDILPEDVRRQEAHFAPFPEDLCRIPLLATSPRGGVVLDPFCGTGTTMRVACELERKSVGIDLSPRYLAEARARCAYFLARSL